MARHWIGSRVSLPHMEDLKTQMGGDTPMRTWGPHSTFLYPLRGGTGDIFQRIGHRPLPSSSLAEGVLSGLKQAGLYAPAAQPLSTWKRIEEYGYPIPSLERDRALATIHPFLEEKGVFSRGRFCGWKYEIGNMDHSFIQGMEWAERIIEGEEERMYAQGRFLCGEKPIPPGLKEV